MPISCLSDGPRLRVVGLIDSTPSLLLTARGLSSCKVRVVRLGDWLNSGAILWISVFPCAVWGSLLRCGLCAFLLCAPSAVQE